MSTKIEADVKVIGGVQEIAWLAEAVRESRATIDALPDQSRPSWHRSQEISGNSNH